MGGQGKPGGGRLGDGAGLGAGVADQSCFRRGEPYGNEIPVKCRLVRSCGVLSAEELE
jgi:hypothetical protein